MGTRFRPLLFRFWNAVVDKWLVLSRFTLKTQNIAVASTILIFFNVAALTFVEWEFFNNAISLRQGIGLGLGAIAIMLLE